jgi:hypothetical protein
MKTVLGILAFVALQLVAGAAQAQLVLAADGACAFVAGFGWS